MIAIQCIETWWTKASRGAPGATTRAATPEALVLPRTGLATGEVLLQRVFHEERHGFEARSEATELSLQEAQRELRGVVLHAGLDAIDVMFTWSQYTVGAPQRRNGHAIRLEADQWCCIVHNGRFEENGEWCYQQTTLNVAYRPSGVEIFVATAPRKVDDHREQLW